MEKLVAAEKSAALPVMIVHVLLRPSQNRSEGLTVAGSKKRERAPPFEAEKLPPTDNAAVKFVPAPVLVFPAMVHW